MKRLTISDVIDLPKDHPLMVEFLKQAEQEMQAGYDSCLQDEQGVAYFNRFVAGDR